MHIFFRRKDEYLFAIFFDKHCREKGLRAQEKRFGRK